MCAQAPPRAFLALANRLHWPVMTEDKEDQDIEEHWDIPSIDDFSIGLVEPIRKTTTGMSDEAFIYAALSVNAFMRAVRAMGILDSDYISNHVGHLEDEFTKERLEQVKRIVTGSKEPTGGDSYKSLVDLIRSSEKGSQFSTEKLAYAVLALHAISASAGALKSTGSTVDPDSKLSADEKVFAKFVGSAAIYLLEEFTPERYEQLRHKAAVRGMLGQLIIQ